MSQRREFVGSRHRGRRRALHAFAVLAVVAGGTVVGATAAVAATSITVTPHTGLVDGQTVTVAGSGWASGDTIYICEAVDDGTPSQDDCGGFPPAVFADSAGNFSVSFVVARIIHPGSTAGPVDCAAPAHPCVIGAAHLDLSNLALATLEFAPATPFILPQLVQVPEGNSGTTNLTVPVALSYASSSTVTAHWATNSAPGAPVGEADPADDFTPASGTVSFAPGDTAESLTISVNGDRYVETTETIVLTFSQATNAVVGTFQSPRILDDDIAVVTGGGGTVAEGDSGTTNLLVPVTLSNPSHAPVTVQWRTASVGGPPPHADPANDFTVTSGVVTFSPGQTAKTVTISVNGDTVVEPNDWILLSFTNPTAPYRRGGYWGLGFGVILNDD